MEFWRTLVVEFWRILVVDLWETLANNSGVVIAVFTVVLAVTTIVYVVVSVKLLKQSRNALLADITLRVMGTCRKEIKVMQETKGGEQIKEVAFVKGGLKGFSDAFAEIDKRLGMCTAKLFEVCLNTMVEEKENVYFDAMVNGREKGRT